MIEYRQARSLLGGLQSTLPISADHAGNFSSSFGRNLTPSQINWITFPVKPLGLYKSRVSTDRGICVVHSQVLAKQPFLLLSSLNQSSATKTWYHTSESPLLYIVHTLCQKLRASRVFIKAKICPELNSCFARNLGHENWISNWCKWGQNHWVPGFMEK